MDGYVMETRNILDSLANIIGSLSLPEGTSEEQWTQALANYNGGVVALVGELIDTYSLNETSTTTTSSSTPSTIGSLSLTPERGSYLAFFSGNIYTDGASAQGEFGIYVNAVQIASTRREVKCNLQLLGGLVTISLNSIGVGTYSGTRVDLDGTQTIDVRFKSNNGGTIGFKERSFTLMKVA